MGNMSLHSFRVDNFEGPLDLLWQLIQQNEVDIYEISLHHLTKQYMDKAYELLGWDLNQGSEFIASTAALVWLKSKSLLPKNAHQESTIEDEHDPRFEVIHQLVDYCRFRQAGKELVEREQRQSSIYVRNAEERDSKKDLGIAHLSIDDLAVMFRQVIAKAQKHRGTIYEEEWQVGDKITLMRALLAQQAIIPFREIFNSEKSREELIVTFLALLELMKTGEIKICNDTATQAVSITRSAIKEAINYG